MSLPLTAWLLTMRPAARAFARAARDPESAQRDLLDRLIRANRASAFGEAHGFARLRSVDEFRDAVPVRTYDDLQPWIERAARGERQVLTTAPVVMFEQSSGSAGPAKLIPYTAALVREFQRALGPWLCDLYDGDPALGRGPAYWSVTPLARSATTTDGGIPIGFDDDSQYLGPLSAWFANRILAAPRELARCGNLDAALYLTLRFLLQQRRLTLLSVWSPSMLGVLMRTLVARGGQLAADLRSGGVGELESLPVRAAARVARRAKADARQADRLTAMLRAGEVRPLELWPNLRLISCWTSAEARGVLGDVARLFPGVAIQGKGLLATEGVVTIPMGRYGGAVPALTSHFLEFLEPETSRSFMVHELESGREYLPVLTTGGGLWRCRLGNRVRVTSVPGKRREPPSPKHAFGDGGHLPVAGTEVGTLPVLEFVGREDGVCDLRGEKLSPAFVSGVLDTLRASGTLNATFAMLAPCPGRDGYVLFTDAASADAALLDRRLRGNPHYAYCRDLGQLRAPRIVFIDGDAHAQYLRHCERMQRRAGAAKLVALDRHDGWHDAFRVRTLEMVS